ncbi:MAG: TolC family protein [Candidatus Gastranaerophilaceae bacterium]
MLWSEKKLEKAKIDIRVAKRIFPRFNITGVWIFNTIAPGNFFNWESTLASIMAAAVTDIFAGGRKIANLKIKKAVYEQLFEDYKQVDLTALKEVNSSLYMLKNDNQNYLNIKRKNEFENKNLNLVNISFNEGVMSQMDVMQGQNKFYELNKVLINRRAAYLIDVITLYKAVGAKL